MLGEPDETITDPMTDEYRYVLKALLQSFGIYYWDIGGQIVVRAIPYLDGDGIYDQYNGILNAEHRAVLSIIDEDFATSIVGQRINGKIYRIPDHIMALRQPGPRKYPYKVHSCPFMRAVVTGRPMRSTEHSSQSK